MRVGGDNTNIGCVGDKERVMYTEMELVIRVGLYTKVALVRRS